MYRVKIYSFIYLLILLPIFLQAAALNKYTAPTQSATSMQTKEIVNQRIYIDFQRLVDSYSPQKREKMKAYYHQKLKDAIRVRNLDAATHYEKLLGILNSK
jgi:hypothetical protein